MILAIISFAGAVISGFIDQKWGLGVGALVTVVFSWLHLSSKSKVKASAAGDSIELKNLKSEFKNRFNKSLTDKAVITGDGLCGRRSCELTPGIHQQRAYIR
jgi:hypothetical protein